MIARPVLIAAAIACGCRSDGSPTFGPKTAPPQPTRASVDPELIRTLAILATEREPAPDAVAAVQRDLETGKLTLAAYIEQLIARDDFANRVAPLMILRHFLSQNAAGAPSGYVLAQAPGTEPYYYLGDTPCRSDQTVEVHPWWNLDTKVKVCADSYRPTQWEGQPKKGDLPMACLTGVGANLVSDGGGKQRCGCGPYLMRCFQSADQRTEVVASLRAELADTVTHVVANDLPAETIFTSNETMRDRNAEYVRREEVLEATRGSNAEAVFRDLATWPDASKWAPRAELATGEHAGLLTSSILLYNLNDLRQRMTVMYDVLWCMQPDSVGATPESVIGIHDPNLQLGNSGWQQLAARPLCTNCHARLDYGLQFFKGWPHGNRQAFYAPAQQLPGRGPLYGDNHDDPRGEAELDPQGFAGLAVAQPEFRSCMAHDIASYVFGDSLSHGQLEQIEQVAATPGQTSIHALMRAALGALAASWSRDPHANAVATTTAMARAGDVIAVTGDRKREIADHCLDCHDHAPGLVDLSTAELSRSTVVAMLGNVAYERMPKGHPLDAAARREFLDAFIPAAFSATDAVIARAFYVDRMAALPAFRPEVLFELVRARIGTAGAMPWRLLEKFARPDRMQVTPGLVTIDAVATMEACRAKFQDPAAVKRCIDDAIAAESISISPR